MALKETVDVWKKRLKLDGHHSMERFGIATVAFATSMTLIMGGTIATAISNNIEQTANTALYTPSFTTSKTKLSGEVSGVYLSEDRTRSLVLMNFGSSAAQSMSVDANNYQAFVTATDARLNQQTLSTQLDGGIVVFGTSGYMGIVLESAEPFDNQILNLTVRSNSELVYNDDDSSALREDLAGDQSFRAYDQWRVFVNPGAGEVRVTPALNSAGAEFSAVQTYYDLIVKPKESEARLALDGALAQMQVDLAKIEEFTAQAATTSVDNVKIVPPAVPDAIAGDTVTGQKIRRAQNASPTAQPEESGDADKPVEPTELGFTMTDDPLTLDTTWVKNTGYDFDWRSGNVRHGYLSELVPEGQSYVSFLANKAAGSATGAATGTAAGTEEETASTGLNLGALSWILTDGTDLARDYSAGDAAMQPLKDVMNNLTQAYQTYYRHKVEYQTSGLEKLITLEVTLKNVDTASSVNTNDAVLTY